MNLRRLEYFVAVAELRHFRRAAERLHVAQPALSVQVAKLEQELGVPLLDRNRRGVELTEAGAALFERARLLLPGLRDAFHETTSVGQGRSGRLVVGFVGSVAYHLLPMALRAAERELPRTRIALREMRSVPQIDALAAGELDLAMVRWPRPMPGLVATPLFAEPFVVALPAAHPLARLPRIPIQALAHEPLITLPAGAGPLRDEMLAEHALSGAPPRIVDEAFEMPTMLGLVSAGRGVALLPASVTNLRFAEVAYRPLEEPRRKAEIWLMRRGDDRRPIVASFLELVKDLQPNALTEASMLAGQI